MKLLELDFVAYGPFTDARLDLKAGDEGLHLIYGLNEAGKSSALRALVNLLFGIPARVNDDFIHAKSKLRIGARLQRQDGTRLNVIRRKGNKNTLLNAADNQPIDEEMLAPFLDGVSREMFTSLYGLDQHRLSTGGRELINGSGHLSQALFAAGSGLSGLRALLQSLEKDAGDLFRPRASKPAVNHLTHRFKEIRAEMDRRAISPNKWIELNRHLEQSHDRKRQLDRQILELRTEIGRSERILQALPKIATRSALLQELQEMGPVVELPADFPGQRQQIESSLQQAQSQCRRLQKQISQMETELSELSPEKKLIGLQQDIDALYQRAGSYRKTGTELPRRKSDRDRLQAEATEIFKNIFAGHASQEIETLRLPDAQIARLRRLGRELEAIETRQAAAIRQHRNLGLQSASMHHEIERLQTPKASSLAEQILNQVQQKGDLEKSLAAARQDWDRNEQGAQMQLARLGLWQGWLESLLQLALPTGKTVVRFEDEFHRLDLQIDQLAESIQHEQTRQQEAQKAIEQLQAAGPIPSESELDEQRALRDTIWRKMRALWENKPAKAIHPEKLHSLAEKFEFALQTADQLADRIRADARRVAELANLKTQQSQSVQTIRQLEEQLDRHRQTRQDQNRQWVKLWKPLDITPLPPREMADWMQRWHQLVAKASEGHRIQEQIDRIEAESSHMRRLMAEAFEKIDQPPAGETESLLQMQTRLKAAIDRLNKNTHRRETLQQEAGKIQLRLEEAGAEKEAADTQYHQWQKDWEKAVGAIGLPAGAMPSEMEATLTALQQLFSRVDEAQKLEGQIHDMETEREQFDRDVAHLCRHAAPELKKKSPNIALGELNQRMKDAITQEGRRKELAKQLRQTEASLEKETDRMQTAQDQLDGLCRQAQVNAAAALSDAEMRSQRYRELKTQCRQHDQDLTTAAARETLAAFIEQAQAQDPDRLHATAAEKRSHLQSLEIELESIHQQIGQYRNERSHMEQGASTAELASEAHAILAELKEQALQYARLKTAAVILNQQMEQYRRENQGPLLSIAGEIFAALTCNAFSELVVDYDRKDTPVLKARRADGSLLGLDQMSTGSADQLFLALRLAAIDYRNRSKAEPMPLILDDILINFDDPRSQATLKVLSDLSGKSQILFFTHHRHLLELARQSLPSRSLFVHHL